MNGACHVPSSATMWGRVGGAFRSAGKRVSTRCGATAGAPIVATSTTAAASPIELLAGTRIHHGQCDVGNERSAREEQRARTCAPGDQIHITRSQGVEHETAEARPRRDDLNRERSAEQCAD